MPGTLLSIVFLIDLLSYIRMPIIESVSLVREILIIIAFVLFSRSINLSRWIADNDILKDIKFLVLSVIGLYLSFLLPKILFFIRSTPDMEDLFTSIPSLNALIYTSVSSISATILASYIFFLLRNLIYIRRKRTTHRNFIFIIFAIALALFYSNLQGKNTTSLTGQGTIGIIIQLILIFAIVLNSFRTAWINYLDKRQKIICFLLGIFLLPFLIMLQDFAYYPVIYHYSISLGAFLRQMNLFLLIYLGMALLSLLLHLPTAGLYDRKRKEVESLFTLSRSIALQFDTAKLITEITHQSNEIMNADAVWLQLYDNQTGIYHLASSIHLNDEQQKIVQRHGFDQLILTRRDSILVNEMGKDDELKSSKEMHTGIGSLLGVPLISYEKFLGILYAAKTEEYGFSSDDQNMLRAFADQAAIALENSRLVEESIIKERLEQELKIAHEAQMKLLPKSMPQVKKLDIDAICVTANDVGGDYYDFFELARDRVAIVIGDVSGKGPEAAFYMAEMKGIIESLSRLYLSPKELLFHANQILYENFDKDMFVTMIYAVFDLTQMQLTFCRAGHCPLIHHQSQSGDTRFIEPRGIGLGLETSGVFQKHILEHSLPFHRDDLFIFYTDGIIEARNKMEEEFGEQNLLQATIELASLSAAEVKQELIARTIKFCGASKPHDDLTMVVVKVR